MENDKENLKDWYKTFIDYQIEPKLIKPLFLELEETLIRLHAQLRAWEEEGKRFKNTYKKLEIKKNWNISLLRKKDKMEMELYANRYKYYQGKYQAYIFVLEKLGQIELVNVLRRLRGMYQKGNNIQETRFYRS